MNQFQSVVITVAALSLPAMAQEFDRRATLTGGDPSRGRCAVVVVVDGAAQIEIRRSEARLIDLSGAPATWRRFECTVLMPPDPREFNFRAVTGRGRQQLLQSPRGGAPAVIRIDDPQGGAGEYRFELAWRGGGGLPPGPPPFITDDAIRVCQDAVRQKASDRFRTDRIQVRRIGMDDAPGRREWVVGVIDVRRDRVDSFRFACSVDFAARRVRSVQIDPMDKP
jgi:hypothetical protein